MNSDDSRAGAAVDAALTTSPFVLDLAALGLAEVADSFPGGTLRLGPRRPGAEQGVVGTGLEGPFAGMDVTVDRGTASPTLTGTAVVSSEPWRLPSSFPSLRGTVLEDLAFTSATLTITLAAPTDASQPSGFVFHGVLNGTETAGGFGTLVGDAPELTGRIGTADEGGSVTLVEITVPIHSRPEIGVVTFDDFKITVGGRAIRRPVTGGRSVVPHLAVAAEATVKDVAIPFSVMVSGLGQEWRLAANLTKGLSAVWDELTSLLNRSVSLGAYLPADLHLDDVLVLDDLVVTLDLTAAGAGKLAAASLGVRSAKPWTVARLGPSDMPLTIDSLGLGVVVRSPFDSQARAVAVLLGAQLTLGKEPTAAVLGFSARYPDPDVRIHLASGVLPVDQIAALMVGPGMTMPGIEVKELDLELSGAEQRLSVEAVGEWSLIDDGTLIVEEVRFAVDHTAAGTAVEAGGVLSIAGAELVISASHTPPDLGWRLSGQATGLQVHIGALVDDLLAAFGAHVTLPEPLATATITALAVSLDTGARAFTFQVTTTMSFGGRDAEAQLAIDVRPTATVATAGTGGPDGAGGPGGSGDPGAAAGSGGYVTTLAGTLTLAGKEFALRFERGAGATRFVAAYVDLAGGTVNLGALLASLNPGKEVLDLVSSMDISLKSALLAYDLSPTGTSMVFAADIGLGIDLTRLPLVGHVLPAGKALTVAFRPVVATRLLSDGEVTALGGLVPDGVAPLPSPIREGLKLVTRLNAGGTPIEFPLDFTVKSQGAIEPATANGTTPAGTDTSAPALPGSGQPGSGQPGSGQPGAGGVPAKPAATDGTRWIALQRSFGPLNVDRVGVRFAKGTLAFLVDASLTAGPLTLALDGLGVSVELEKLKSHDFTPSFDLQGVGVELRTEALEVLGALLHITDGGLDEYDGMAVLTTPELSLSAIGSYAELNGVKSLFLYATLDTPLGGPPFFFVTGLAAGIGVNREVRIPPLAQLNDFPLVAVATKPAGSQPVPTTGGANGRAFLAQKMRDLHEALPVSPGQFVLAVGLKFTTFNLLECFALLLVQVGARRVQFDLIGLADVSLPPPEAGKEVRPLAELQLAVRATVSPQDGVAGLFGELTSRSWVVSPDCRITGGFAVCAWFAGAHRGDFVVTVGGYAPNYRVPDHYPRVPRLGFSWQVCPELSVKGGMYFALLPHAAMAGGELEAVYRDGSTQAWFRAGAHFLVAWEPFHYEASIYLDMAVRWRKDTVFGPITINVHASADLAVWGPTFAGKARVSVGVVHFRIAFGPQRPERRALTWDEFAQAFLPALGADGKRPVVAVSVSAGLSRRAGAENAPVPVVEPTQLVLLTNSVVPADATLGIAPMDVPSVTSTHTVTVARDGKPTDQLTPTPVRKRAPRALWGTRSSPDLNAAGWIEDTVAGYELRPGAPEPVGASAPVAHAVLDVETTRVTVPAPAPAAQTFVSRVDGSTLGARVTATADARRAVLDALGFDPVLDAAGLPGALDDLLVTPPVGVLEGVPS